MKRKRILLLIGVLALAAFFRIWQLDSIPPGLYPDEAINGNDAFSNPGRLFYPENNGREGLFMQLLWLSFSFFGVSIWSIRIVSALAGLATVLGTYLLVKEIFYQSSKAWFLAFFSSFFLAVSFWHVNFSRMGFRAILAPLILTFSFWLLFKGFRTKKMRYFVLSGAVFSLGFYTYTVFRLAVLLLIAALIILWLIRQERTKKEIMASFAFLLAAAFIIGLPIGIYFLQHPDFFIGRATGVSIFAQENPIKSFTESIAAHLAMFNWKGDSNWRHNLSGSPQLLWPVGMLFLMGLAISIKNSFRFIKDKKYWPYLFFLAWWVILLLPSMLTAEGVPHALRSIGAVIPSFVFAALGLEFLLKKLKGKIEPKGAYKTILLIIIFLAASSFIYAQYFKYFVLWGQNEETKGAFSKDYVEMGKYLASLDPEIKKYVVVNKGGVKVPLPDGIPMPSQTMVFMESEARIKSIYLNPDEISSIFLKEKGLVVLFGYDESLALKIYRMFPESKISLKGEFLLFKINI